MSLPKVSVIIPSYNRPHKLPYCLDACAALDYPDFEVIVVDDGSPTPYDDIVSRYTDKMNITLLRQENAGPSSARNLGARHATGDVLAFTDDDCAPLPDWLHILVAHHQAGVMVGGYTINALTSNVFSATSQLIVDIVYEHYNANPNDAQFLTSSNILLSKADFDSINGFHEDVRAAEDREFCDRWRYSHFKIHYIPAATIHHTHHLTLWRFINQHLHYGKGAWLYHSIRAERKSGQIQDDLSFHTKLGVWWRAVMNQPRKYRIQIALLLVVWQLANAVGFFYMGFKAWRK